jgi:shikimate kinase
VNHPTPIGAANGRGIALGGFMGCGKTTVGRRLAELLDWPFVDLDDLLVARDGPIAAQFAAVGEAGFRFRERALVLELCDGRQRVLATGGGTWIDPDSRAALRGSYWTVVLHAPLEVLRSRVHEDGTRPLWGAGAVELLASRGTAYAEADAHVDTAQKTVDEVVQEVLCTLGSR